MTTMSGQGACPNAGPVARLQAELEQVEGELVLARAELARLRTADLRVADADIYVNDEAGDDGRVVLDIKPRSYSYDDAESLGRTVLARVAYARDRAGISETLVCW